MVRTGAELSWPDETTRACRLEISTAHRDVVLGISPFAETSPHQFPRECCPPFTSPLASSLSRV
jgi:hypothetical protein